MRLLHTSDWHLGQSLHNFERHYEHQRFLDWLLDTVVAEQADALLIAGDIFDNANPSSASQKQLYRFLQQAKERAPHLNLIVIAGNHDSPGRLEAPGPLLEAHGTRVIGAVQRREDGEIDVESLVLPLTGRSGAIQAWCLAVPFLRPGDVPRVAVEDGADPYLAGIALLYKQALELALSGARMVRRSWRWATATWWTARCRTIPSAASLSAAPRCCRPGSSIPPSSTRRWATCTWRSAVGKQQHIRYCGSPIPLSFAEVGYQHQMLRIDIDGATVGEITPLTVPRAVDLLRVPAKPAPIAQVLEELAALEVEAASPDQQPFLEVRVLLDAPEPGLRSRIEAALDGKPVRLAKIETSSPARTSSIDNDVMTLDQLEKLKPDDIFRQLYQQRFGNDAPADTLTAFAELMLP
jgi:exonuclease SbcD